MERQTCTVNCLGYISKLGQNVHGIYSVILCVHTSLINTRIWLVNVLQANIVPDLFLFD